MEKTTSQVLVNAAVAGIFAAGVAVASSGPALAGGNQGGGNDCNSCKGHGGSGLATKAAHFLADKSAGGNADPLNTTYLARLKALADRIEPAMVSDHLCWTGVAGENLHDLLPLPYTEEAIRHVVARVEQVQEALGRPILLENVSSYLTYT